MKKTLAFSASIVGLSAAALAVVPAAVAAPGGAASTEWITDAAQLGAESSNGYPAGWFLGTAAGAPGTNTFAADGVTVSGGVSQFLHGTTQPGAELTDLATSARFDSSGDAVFQIPMYLNSGGAGSSTDFTTLRPATPGDDDLADGHGHWVSSQAFGGIAAGAVAELDEFQAEIDADFVDASVVGYGFYATDATVKAVQFDGALTRFTPTATSHLGAPTSTVTEIGTNGVEYGAAGFYPNERVDVAVRNATTGEITASLAWTADDDGNVADTLVIPAAKPGVYTVTAAGQESGIVLTSELAVTADEATTDPEPVDPEPTEPTDPTDSSVPVAPAPVAVPGAAHFAG